VEVREFVEERIEEASGLKGESVALLGAQRQMVAPL
jgi:hypothetical protein